MARQYLPHESRRTERDSPARTTAGRTLAVGLAHALAVPAALAAVAHPLAALAVGASALAAAVALRIAARRVTGRRATVPVPVPVLGLSVEVAVSADGE
jgi:hypothetical protein